MVPNYARPPWQPPNFKKGKALASLERDTKKAEKKQKVENACARAKARDLKLKPSTRGCRWIHRTDKERKACRVSKWREAMHFEPRSTAPALADDDKNIVTGCPVTHQGPGSIHDGKKRFRILDKKLRCAGPLACEEKISGKWVEIGRESAPGVPAKSGGADDSRRAGDSEAERREGRALHPADERPGDGGDAGAALRGDGHGSRRWSS